MVHKFFDKKASGGAIKSNQQLANDFINRLLKKFKKEEFILQLKTIFGVLIL